MKRGIRFSSSAWAHHPYRMVQNKATLRRINALIIDVLSEPCGGIGKPEPLKHAFSGWWSGRIDQEHRKVDKVREVTRAMAALRHPLGE